MALLISTRSMLRRPSCTLICDTRLSVPTALMARRAASAVGAPYVLVAHGGDVTRLERSRLLRDGLRLALLRAPRAFRLCRRWLMQPAS